MNRVAGKVALITGAAMGIGRACAELLAREGAAVMLTDRATDEGGGVARELATSGARAEFLAHDVTREADWIRVVEQTVASFGKLDILVNNAGVGRAGDVEHTSLEEWRALLAVNLDGVFLGIKHAIPAMRSAGGGSIINLSSIEGLVSGRRLLRTTRARAACGCSRNPRRSIARRAARRSA